MAKIPVAEHLTDNEYKLLLSVYADHNRSMGMEDRKSHSLTHIVGVDRDSQYTRLRVYYENGHWWHYDYNGTWY